MVKKKKSVEKEVEPTAINASPSYQLRKLLQEYLTERKNHVKGIEIFINKRSEASYVTNIKINSAIGSHVKPISLQTMVNQDLYSMKDKLSEYKDYSFNFLKRLKDVTASCGLVKDENSIDQSYLEGLVSKLQQQILLEVDATEKILDLDQQTIDHDCLITLLAYFKYNPYVKVDEIEVLTEKL